MAPIRKGDGTTIKPTDYQQIRKGDGTVLFDAIPDSVLHRYDATEISATDGDSITSWADGEGSLDLTGGSPTYTTNGISGMPSLDFDGTDDNLEASLASDITQPNMIFAVVDSTETSQARILDTETLSGGRQILATYNRDTSGTAIWASNWLGDGTNVGGEAIIGGVYDGSNSEIHKNNTTLKTGDAGTNNLGGVNVGGGGDKNTNALIGEVIIADGTDADSIVTYLNDKWSVF